ncbi:MAG: hypothetical protein [Siphoviridae sp. ctjeG17]|jgi:hypothetical protein|nr:MAG: hypothetical protein [Siphoviridae sp. ctjeG17]
MNKNTITKKELYEIRLSKEEVEDLLTIKDYRISLQLPFTRIDILLK